MKKSKKRKYDSPDSSLKNDYVSKKHKADVLLYENQLLINWHEVKIILDATVVEKYLNNQKSGSKILPSHREKILVQKIPRLSQDVFSENSNVMVKLEIPEDIKVDDNLSLKESLVFDDVPVKPEEGIPVLDSLDNETFHNREFIEPLHEDFQCQDNNNFTVEAALKNEVVESQNCYKEVTIDQEFKDALKNEELFVGEEFKYEESISRYENVESINRENNEEIIKKSTRSSRKRKKCLDCDDCDHRCRTLKKSRVSSHNTVVTPKLPIKESKISSDKSKSPPIPPSKPECSMRTKERKINQESLNINSPAIPEPRKREYRLHHCDHCDYKSPRGSLIKHFRRKHAYLFPNDLVQCPNCDMKFNSCEEMQRHRPVCLLFLICKFCLVNVPSKAAMVKHMKTMHPDKICAEKGGKIVDEVCRYSMKGVMKTLELTPIGRKYLEIRKYHLEMESELIKLYCPKCAVTHDQIMRKTAPRCDSCQSRLLFQCQKCKETRTNYRNVWRHLMSKNSGCNISENLSFMDREESSNAAEQASSNEPHRHDCEICDFKGSTTTQLYEHVLNVHLDNGMIRNGYYKCSKCGASFRFGNLRFKQHQEFCGIAVRFPCRFCPTTCYTTKRLSDHIAIMHFDELDGRDINEFLQEALDFKRMVRGVNLEKFNDKLRNKTVKTEREYYHKGIENMLKSVCIECKTDGTQESEHCPKCQASFHFVCLKCDELFSKYSVAWIHATRTCENRSFTLTVGKRHKSRAKLDESTSNKNLLHCDLCNFKNASKSILCKHIERIHAQSGEMQGRFTCPKCYRSFVKSTYLQQHRLWCKTDFIYTCPFCDKSSPKLNVIEYHMKKYHVHDVRCQDTLYKILQQVFENKKARPTKPRDRFDQFGRILKRTFLENIKLATFSCSNCDETVHKNFRSVADTRRCPKCNGEMRVHCKICNRVFSKWESIANHFQRTDCGGVTINREPSIKTHELDHSYSLRKPPPETTM